MRARLLHALELVALYAIAVGLALLAGFTHYAFLALLLN